MHPPDALHGGVVDSVRTALACTRTVALSSGKPAVTHRSFARRRASRPWTSKTVARCVSAFGHVFGSQRAAKTDKTLREKQRQVTPSELRRVLLLLGLSVAEASELLGSVAGLSADQQALDERAPPSTMSIVPTPVLARYTRYSISSPSAVGAAGGGRLQRTTRRCPGFVAEMRYSSSRLSRPASDTRECSPCGVDGVAWRGVTAAAPRSEP